MNTKFNDILDKYPEQKPICLNYAEMRKDLLAVRALTINELIRVLHDKGLEDAGRVLNRLYD